MDSMVFEKALKFLGLIIPSMIRVLQRGGSDSADEACAAFCVADGTTGKVLFGPSFAHLPAAKIGEHLVSCEEKAMRLAGNPDHISSWQSRNPEMDRWGGAIRAGSLILSMSGMREAADEALMLAVARKILKSPEEQQLLDQIAKLSKNPYWGALRLLDLSNI